MNKVKKNNIILMTIVFGLMMDIMQNKMDI